MAYFSIANCSAISVEEALALPFDCGAILSGWLETRQKDAPKRTENISVPDKCGVVRKALGETREHKALPVFGIANLGVSQRKIMEKDFHQWYATVS